MLAPLSNLVVIADTPESQRQTRPKVPSHWDKINQQAFDNVKANVIFDVNLAFPDCTQGFEVYTDSSKLQLGAVITQANRPLALFSQKLSPA